MPKVISVTTESEVVFMGSPEAEYVSLVSHAANRTPFQVLKNDKGGNNMEKSLVAILIPKSLEKAEADKFLEGMRTEDVRAYDTYKSYIQVAKEHYDAKEVEVITIDAKEHVFGLVAPIEKDGEEGADPEAGGGEEGAEGTADEKQIDYATMDSLYDQLYAMADIVGGALRQEGQKPKERTKVILSAIDNFRNFAEVLMNNTNEKSVVSQEAIDRHPLSFAKEEADVIEKTEETKTQFEELVAKSSTDTLSKVEELIAEAVAKFKEELDAITASVPENIEKATETMTAVTDDLEANIKAVKEDVAALKKTPKGKQSDRDEDVDHKEEEDKGFKGTIFRNK